VIHSERMPTGDDRPVRRLSESNRVEAFSDGVLAIALTLLVLDLHSDASRGDFGHELADQWPAYIAYLAAFLNIAAIWINHHDMFTRVRSVDTRVVGANILILLVASLFPWPAAVIAAAVHAGDHDDQVISAALYAGIGFCVPLAFICVYGYLARHPELLTHVREVDYMRRGTRRSLVSIVVYPVAALIALIAPVISLIAYVALPAFFIATLLRETRRDVGEVVG
jgi:uncharacterized membrane protein